MSTNVIRIAKSFGGTLGSPFFHDLDVPERLWTDSHLRVDDCTMNPEHIDPPAPGCHCGMWAATSQGSLHRCLIAMHRYLSGKARFMVQFHDELLTPEHLAEHATTTQRAAIEQHRGDWGQKAASAHGFDWTDYVIVGCRTLDPRSEPAVGVELNYPGPNWDDAITLRQLYLQCTRPDAVRNLIDTDTPRDWRRYRHLQITHVWMSDALAEYAPDLTRRYSAQVITIPDNRGGWLAPFMRSGELPGLGEPTPTQRRTAMTPAMRQMNAVMGRA